MEIQEAIVHARQVAEKCKVENRDCACQHDELADWLEELLNYRALGSLYYFQELVKDRSNYFTFKEDKCK